MNEHTVAEKASFVGLLILIVWLPIPLASHRPLAWSIFEIVVAIQTIALVAAYRFNFPWSRLASYLWLLIPLLCFQLWSLVQLIPLPIEWLRSLSPSAYEVYQPLPIESATLSLDRGATWSAMLKGVAYLLVVVNSFLLIDSSRRVKLVMMAIVISGTFQAFYAAIMVLTDTKVSPVFGFVEKGIATGSFVYKNHLANYLLMSLSIGFGLIVAQLHQSASGSWQNRSKRWLQGMVSSKMLIRLSLVVMVIALVMTRSRMGNTAFFLVTILAGVVALTLYRNRPRALTILICSLLIVDTLVVGTLFGLVEVKERLENTSVLVESRDQVIFWGQDIIKDYPLTGVGVGGFYSIFPSYTQFNIGYYDYAHNDYLQFMVEAGIPMTIILGSSILWAIYLSLKTVKTRNNKIFKGASLGCLMGIVGMLIHITVDFQLQPPANAVTFLLILVLVGCCSTLQSKKLKRQSKTN